MSMPNNKNHCSVDKNLPLFLNKDKFAFNLKTNNSNTDSKFNLGELEINKGNYKKARDYFLDSFILDKNIDTAINLSTCFSKLEQFSDAISFFESNLKYFENNGTYWAILATHNYCNFDYEGAAGASYNAIFKFNIDLSEIWKIFVFSAKKINRCELLYKVSKKSLEDALNNPYVLEGYLSSCCSLNLYEEAYNFLNNINLTKVMVSNMGEISGIIASLVASIIARNEWSSERELAWNELAAKLSPDVSDIKWNLSLSQLKNCMISECYKNYSARFSWSEFPSPVRIFKKPKWNQNVKTTSRILLWYEQGIGDELRFISTLPFFKATFPNLILEPSDKLVELMTNTFPEIEVRYSTVESDLSTTNEDFDYHLPIGDMFLFCLEMKGDLLRDSTYSFSEKYLKPDKLRNFYWNDKFIKSGGKPLVGFCWRSSFIDRQRSREYSVLEQWRNLIESNLFRFVNLQYDLTQTEFVKKYPEYKGWFVDIGHLDQKDDSDGTAALINNLDFVLSPASTPSMISSCLGIPTLIYATPNPYWFSRNKKFSEHPLFKNSLIYPSLNVAEDESLVPEITDFLMKKFKK